MCVRLAVSTRVTAENVKNYTRPFFGDALQQELADSLLSFVLSFSDFSSFPFFFLCASLFLFSPYLSHTNAENYFSLPGGFVSVVS